MDIYSTYQVNARGTYKSIDDRVCVCVLTNQYNSTNQLHTSSSQPSPTRMHLSDRIYVTV